MQKCSAVFVLNICSVSDILVGNPCLPKDLLESKWCLETPRLSVSSKWGGLHPGSSPVINKCSDSSQLKVESGCVWDYQILPVCCGICSVEVKYCWSPELCVDVRSKLPAEVSPPRWDRKGNCLRGDQKVPRHTLPVLRLQVWRRWRKFRIGERLGLWWIWVLEIENTV